ncbi:MAG: type IV toxin-antitoxin system AbiEi family antitoxin [Anaerostipes sp.]|nr:type IV toxin-antitoxin system AbiEi family antitoxin [Anaerostipes sp.]
MKRRKELNSFENIILRVPTIEKCDYLRSTEKEAVFEVETQDGNAFCVILHFLLNGYPKQIKELKWKISENEYHMVIAPYISDKSDAACKARKIGYVDAAGNCLFQYHSLYINIIGNPNKEVSKRALKSVFERTSIVSSRILRLMFEDVRKSWYLKELAEIAGCSIGQVSKVKEFLLNNDWIEQTNEGIIIIAPEEILEEWAKVYGNRENETIESYSLNGIPEIEAQLERMKQERGIDYYLSAFAGGVRYQPVVRYKKIHCYIRSEDIKEAMEYLQLKQVVSGANISLFIPDDECILDNSRVIRDAQVVSPVQIYLDCKSLNGRGEEMADAILKKEILK